MGKDTFETNGTTYEVGQVIKCGRSECSVIEYNGDTNLVLVFWYETSETEWVTLGEP